MWEREEFEKLVKDAILGLPQKIRAKMDNVAVVVENEPTPDQLRKGKVKDGRILLGLYEGVPKTKRGYYNLALPDKITIFQDSIEAVATDAGSVKRTVQETVWHEFAHHFGYSDEQIRKMRDDHD